MHSVADIERAIDNLTPEELAELYAWMDQHRPSRLAPTNAVIFEQGLGLFGSPEDATLLDDVVDLAYQERQRAGRASLSL